MTSMSHKPLTHLFFMNCIAMRIMSILRYNEMCHRNIQPTVMLKYLSAVTYHENTTFTVCSSGIYGLKMDENLA